MRFFRKRNTREVIRGEATEWIDRLTAAESSEAEQARFDEWLQQSSEHERQFVVASALADLSRRCGCKACNWAYVAVACVLVGALGLWIALL